MRIPSTTVEKCAILAVPEIANAINIVDNVFDIVSTNADPRFLKGGPPSGPGGMLPRNFQKLMVILSFPGILRMNELKMGVRNSWTPSRSAPGV